MKTKQNESGRVRELEESIRQKELALHQHYSQIGKSILEIAEGEQRAVNRLVDELIEDRAALAQVRGDIACPACTACNDPDSRFCKRCGVRLDEKKEKRGDTTDEFHQ